MKLHESSWGGERGWLQGEEGGVGEVEEAEEAAARVRSE